MPLTAVSGKQRIRVPDEMRTIRLGDVGEDEERDSALSVSSRPGGVLIRCTLHLGSFEGLDVPALVEGEPAFGDALIPIPAGGLLGCGNLEQGPPL